MYVCMYVCMYAYARPPCVITPTCYREDIFHACMCVGRNVCMLLPRAACLCAIFPSRVLACSPAVRHRVYSLSQGYNLCVYVCSTIGMYAAAVLCMLAPRLPVTRVCMLARRSRMHVHPLPVSQWGFICAYTSSNLCMHHMDQPWTYIAHSRLQMCMYARHW